MAIGMFAVPFDPQHEVFADEDLQKFLLNKQVKRICPEFFCQNGRAYWTVYIEYDPVLPDASRETDGLDEAQRLLFQRLREWRREKAEQQGIAVFIIAKNRELVALARQAPKTVEALRSIHGFGSLPGSVASLMKNTCPRVLSVLSDIYATFIPKCPSWELNTVDVRIFHTDRKKHGHRVAAGAWSCP